ncbi:MAG: hypothetical protein EKK37_12675 [Sphingobacteriales bacterium]|nr:MAG: hypothetical protein EKK37_12675 [Sphingobacteriales bacterium]
MIETKARKQSFLEKFGVYYLGLFKRIDRTHRVFDISDEELHRRINRITYKGIILSSITGIVLVFPTVWVDVRFTNADPVTHYGWVLGITVVCVAIEFYLLFIIALKAVHEVSDLINIHATKNELLNNAIFGVKHILARTALELPDPELKIMGIDPFERISKKNLLILGLLYKAKIFLTNFILKYGLRWTVGNSVYGLPILYEAIPVEAYWNSVVIKRVVHEARLRLFGFALANEIANNVVKDHLVSQLSYEAKIGCLRAIGNAVVMTQNYHPNMIILLLRFQELLQIKEEHRYDDWNLFLQTLEKVNEKERNFLLDLFTVAVAFDGKISRLESENLRSAYKEDYDLYHPRLMQLTECMRTGRLNAALELCRLDFVAG